MATTTGSDPTPTQSPITGLLNNFFQKRLYFFAALATLLAAGVLGIEVWHAHKQRNEYANRQAASVAIAAEHRVMQTLRVADHTLKLVREEIVVKQLWNDQAAVQEILERLTPNLNEILTVSFIRADGHSLAQSNPEIATGYDYSASDFFRFHHGGTDDQFYVERPLIGPVSGRPIFTVSRPMRGPEGELLGIINGSIQPAALAIEFEMLRLGTLGAVGFHHLDTYTIIARQPDYYTTAGGTLERSGLREALAKAPIGVFSGIIADDNEQRVFSYRKLEGLPLAVTVGVAQIEMNNALLQDIRLHLAELALLVLAIVFGATRLMRAHRREIVLQETLAEKDALFKAFFDAAPVGMCLLDRDMHYRLANPLYAEMNGQSVDFFPGKNLQEAQPAIYEKVSAINQNVIASGAYFRDVPFHGKVAGRPGYFGYWSASFFPVQGKSGSIDSMGCIVVDITEQKTAEAALLRSERLLNTVLDTLPVGVWVADPSGQIIRTNPAGEKIWAGKHFVGPDNYGVYKGWWLESGKAISPEDWALARVIRTGENSIGELINIECFDGSHKTIINSAVALRDAGGQIIGAIIVNEDITEMQRSREAVRVARDFFAHTFNAAPVGLAIAGIDGRYTQVNRAMVDFLGYSEAELLTMSFIDITHPDDLETNIHLRDQMLAGKTTTFRMDKRYIRKDGSILWVLLVVSSVLDKNSHPLYTIAQMLDVDQQKRAEQALRESEARFRAIFDNAHTAIVATDKNGCITHFNEAFRGMLGYDATVLKARNFVDFTHPADLTPELLLFNDLRSGKRDHYRLEKRYIKADDSTLWIDISVAALRENGGEIVSFVAVIRDITDNKIFEQNLTRSRKQLRALSAHQTTLMEEDRKHIAREIHDELGQLLTALKMDISLLRMRLPHNETEQENISRMGELVDKTIDVVRHVATNLRPSALDLGLLPAIEWLAEDFAARWEIPCTVDAGGNRIEVNDVMSTTIFRVVQESLTNIARHAEAGKVSIAFKQSPKSLRLLIKDNGRGFDTNIVSQKTGFGFFGMRERVLAVGGQLKIESAQGKGTTVAIVLPIKNEM